MKDVNKCNIVDATVVLCLRHFPVYSICIRNRTVDTVEVWNSSGNNENKKKLAVRHCFSPSRESSIKHVLNSWKSSPLLYYKTIISEYVKLSLHDIWLLEAKTSGPLVPSHKNAVIKDFYPQSQRNSSILYLVLPPDLIFASRQLNISTQLFRGELLVDEYAASILVFKRHCCYCYYYYYYWKFHKKPTRITVTKYWMWFDGVCAERPTKIQGEGCTHAVGKTMRAHW